MAESFKYLLSTDQDVKYGLSVTTIGSQEVTLGEDYPVGNHPDSYMFNPASGRVLDEYQIIYISKGQGRYTDARGTDYHLRAGSVIVLFPGVWHTYCPDRSTGWKEYFIGAKGPVIDGIVDGGFLTSDSPVLNVGLSEKLISLYNEALTIANEGNICSQQYMSGILMHVLGYVLCSSATPDVRVDEIQYKMEMAKIYINENIGTNIDLDKMAKNLTMSYSSFRKCFKIYAGFPPGRYIQDLRLKEACRLLKNTNLSVKRISVVTCFKSVTLFNCLFRKRVGTTPLTFRRMSRATNENEKS